MRKSVIGKGAIAAAVIGVGGWVLAFVLSKSATFVYAIVVSLVANAAVDYGHKPVAPPQAEAGGAIATASIQPESGARPANLAKAKAPASSRDAAAALPASPLPPIISPVPEPRLPPPAAIAAAAPPPAASLPPNPAAAPEQSASEAMTSPPAAPSAAPPPSGPQQTDLAAAQPNVESAPAIVFPPPAAASSNPAAAPGQSASEASPSPMVPRAPSPSRPAVPSAALSPFSGPQQTDVAAAPAAMFPPSPAAPSSTGANARVVDSQPAIPTAPGPGSGGLY